MEKDAWAAPKIEFWQVLHKRLVAKLKEEGIKLRRPAGRELLSERLDVARQIKKIREQSGHTQKDLAEKLGVIQQYISKLESGSENITIDSLKRIAEILGKRLIVKLS
jgi:ribosome-binding protein aMBF1 (putative translation factor)